MPKGKKTCSACGALVSARTSKCECGHEFTAKTVAKEHSSKPEPKPEPKPVRRGITPETMVILTPGTGFGEKSKRPLIPVKPKSISEIPEWIDACQVEAEKRYATYGPTAFIYMARQIWEGDDQNKAINIIKDYFVKLREKQDEEELIKEGIVEENPYF